MNAASRDWLDEARRLHAAAPVVDTLAPNWDSEMYLSPAMVELARTLRARGLSRGGIQAALAAYLTDHIASDPQLRRGYLDWWARAGVTAGSTTLIFAGPPSQGWEHVLGAIARSERLLADLSPAFVKALAPADVVHAHAAGRRCVIYNLQNAEPIADMLDRVDTLYGLGVRVVQLTYNLRNLYGDGCVERRDGGLSRFGVRLVETLNARRIVIDTSHCSDQTTLDAVAASAQPIAVTHTCARALSGHPRGKPDAILRAVADRGGYVGVVICPFMLTSAGAGATLDDVADHILHIAGVVGTGAVGVGTDWGKPYYRIMDWTYEGIVESLRPGEFDWVGWLPEHHFDPTQACAGMETWDLWPHLTAKLLERGLPTSAVRGLVGGNFLRFWSDVCAGAPAGDRNAAIRGGD
jgi:membrane dipeptidase